MSERFDAIVVGAGPAGSAAATVLAQRGWRTAVVEKAVFPRHKVCGEFLAGGALASLERLGAAREVENAGPERIERGFVSVAAGVRVPFDLPAPALGLSRYRLDELLARNASRAGASVRFGARVVAIEGDSAGIFRVRVARGGAEETVEAPVVIGAWGRWDALDRELTRGFLGGRRFFAWSRDYTGDTGPLAGEVRLYVFPGGYCGLSRVEGQEANLAGVVSEALRRRLEGGWEAVVAYARRSHPLLDADLARLAPGPVGFLGTGPVFFTAKPPTERGLLMAGDAAGVLDPFSGEGQSAALASGILAGETAARGLDGEFALERLPGVYAAAWRSRFARRFAWNALFRRFILSPSLGALAGRLAGERLVRFALARMGRE